MEVLERLQEGVEDRSTVNMQSEDDIMKLQSIARVLGICDSSQHMGQVDDLGPCKWL